MPKSTVIVHEHSGGLGPFSLSTKSLRYTHKESITARPSSSCHEQASGGGSKQRVDQLSIFQDAPAERLRRRNSGTRETLQCGRLWLNRMELLLEGRQSTRSCRNGGSFPHCTADKSSFVSLSHSRHPCLRSVQRYLFTTLAQCLRHPDEFFQEFIDTPNVRPVEELAVLGKHFLNT